MSAIKKIMITACFLVIQGCASYGVVGNSEDSNTKKTKGLPLSVKQVKDDQVTIVLAFSGGGSRAAAMSYGILNSLNEEKLPGSSRTLLDEVDSISSVSGGSITAAYYGLHGKEIFKSFKQDVLEVNHEKQILDRLKSISHLSSDQGRSEKAVAYFDDTIFKGRKIGDYQKANHAHIVINASDLGGGARLSFTSEYFSLLCSDITNFSVARAVVASAAVPLIFSPIVVQNYDSCGKESPEWLIRAKQRLISDPEMSLVIGKLESLSNKESRKYIHLVDGGITDNLGLRALYETTELAGGAKALMKRAKYFERRPNKILVIVVDASTTPTRIMDTSLEEPSLSESINAITDIQLHRYNAATLKLFESKLIEWSRELSEPGHKVTPFLVKVRLQNIQDSKKLEYFNAIPTSLNLTAEQTEALISIANELLTSNPEYLLFMKSL